MLLQLLEDLYPLFSTSFKSFSIFTQKNRYHTYLIKQLFEVTIDEEEPLIPNLKITPSKDSNIIIQGHISPEKEITKEEKKNKSVELSSIRLLKKNKKVDGILNKEINHVLEYKQKNEKK